MSVTGYYEGRGYRSTARMGKVGSTRVNTPEAAPDHVRKEVENRLSGSWLVTVGSDPKTRTIRVKSVTVASDNSFLAEAQYGYTCGKFGPVLVAGLFSGGELSLDFLTPANTKISVKEKLTGGLSGSFIRPSGKTETVSLVKYDQALEKTWCASAEALK